MNFAYQMLRISDCGQMAWVSFLPVDDTGNVVKHDVYPASVKMPIHAATLLVTRSPVPVPKEFGQLSKLMEEFVVDLRKQLDKKGIPELVDIIAFYEHNSAVYLNINLMLEINDLEKIVFRVLKRKKYKFLYDSALDDTCDVIMPRDEMVVEFDIDFTCRYRLEYYARRGLNSPGIPQ